MITAEQLREIADHLDTFELTEPACVEVLRYDRHNWVQLGAHTLPALAAELLAWADTLTVDGLDLWRPKDSSAVHIELYGHLPSLTALRVYGGFACTPGFLADLQPGGRQPVSLTVLRCWAEDAEGSAAA